MFLLVVVVLALLGCAAPEKKEEVVKIGVIGPMETKYGLAMKRAAELAAKKINEEGGILGKTVKIVVADTKFDPDVATTEFRRLAQDEKVNIVIGGFSSGIALTMIEVMAETKTLWLGDASSPRLTAKVKEDYEHYKYFFRPIVANASTFPLDMIEMLDNYLNKEIGLNIKKVAIVRDAALWTDDVMQKFEPLLKERGFEIVMDVKVPKGTEDFSTILLEAQEKADVIVPILAHVRGDSLLKQWHDMKIKKLIAGHDLAAIDPDFWNATEGKCFGEIYTADGGAVATPINEKMIEFIDMYKKEFGKLPEAYSAYGVYDAVFLYKAAVEMASKAGESNPFDPDTLVKYLEKFNVNNPFEGVRGKIAFTSNHDLVWGDEFIRNYICQWQEGKQVILYPKNKATGQFVKPEWI